MRIDSGILTIALSLALALPAASQEPVEPAMPVRPPQVFFGGTVQVAQPVGEFGDYVNTGVGLGGSLLFLPTPQGPLGIRLDAGFVNYGNETRTVRLLPTTGRITVDLTTSNNILLVGVGPQLMVPRGPVRPYAYGTAGLAYFVTQSSLRGDFDDDSFASTNNYDDLTFAMGGGAGVYVPVVHGHTPVAIDLGMRYQRNGRASYLTEGGIRDLPNGDLELSPIESQADLLTFQVGVSVGVGPGRRR